MEKQNPNDDRRFEHLISQWCSGELTPNQSSELSGLLRGDDARLRKFTEASQIHSMMTRIYRVGPQYDPRLLLDSSGQERSITLEKAGGEARRSRRSMRRVVMSIAIGILILVGGLRLYRNHVVNRLAVEIFPTQLAPSEPTSPKREASSTPPTPAAPPTATTAIATVIKRVDCGLQASRWSQANSGSFVVGQSLKMDGGLIAIRFARGAEVTIEGPAEFKFLSDNGGFLYSGKLSARVPPAARGFEVKTAFNRVVDLGTEFGVVIRRDGGAETHVFDGEVDLYTDDRLPPERLTRDMAVLDPNQQAPQSMAAKRQRFIRIDSERSMRPDPAERRRTLDIDVMPSVWLDAATGPELDEAGRVVVWRNRGGQAGEVDAWQVDPVKRPTLDPHAANGLPAVVFSHRQIMTSKPFSRGSELTILAVVQLDKISGAAKRQIAHFDLHPNLALDFSRTGQLRARRYEFWGKESHAIVAGSDPVSAGTLMVAGCRYSAQHRFMEIWSNGQLLATGEIDGEIVPISSMVIGGNQRKQRDYLTGLLAEIVFFDECLSPAALRRISHSLMRKYAIQPQ